jgi:hypothetical protein
MIPVFISPLLTQELTGKLFPVKLPGTGSGNQVSLMPVHLYLLLTFLRHSLSAIARFFLPAYSNFFIPDYVTLLSIINYPM